MLMANRRVDKECLDIRLCIDNETNRAIEVYQAEQKIKGKPMRKDEAGAELFCELVKKYTK